MKLLKNEEGIALITSLMFTALTLVISMALLYMVIAGTKTTGALKRYRTALDATYGGTELFTKELIGKALDFSNYSSSSNPFNTYLTTEMGTLTNPTVSNCLRMRLTQPKRLWSTACSTPSGSSPDVSFQLNAASGSPYRVYSNIVDTSEWKITSFPSTGVQITTVLAGNSDPTGGGISGGLMKGGAGYGQSSASIPHYPYMYKIEIQGERQNNPAERGNVTVLYAY